MVTESLIIAIIILLTLNAVVGVYCQYRNTSTTQDYFNVNIPKERVDTLASLIPYSIASSPKKSKNTKRENSLLDRMFPESPTETSNTKKGVSDFNGVSAALFEIDFEGIGADNKHRGDLQKHDPTSSANLVTRDGYSNR